MLHTDNMLESHKQIAKQNLPPMEQAGLFLGLSHTLPI